MNELAYGITDTGKRRDNNEDAFLLLPEKHIYIVSDGMGGHNAGEVASLNAIKTVERYFNATDISRMMSGIKDEMVAAVIEANKEILNLSRTKSEYTGMGCTILISLIQDNLLHTCHVGDSRGYIINQSGIKQITNDHSVVTEMIRDGKMTKEEARHSQMRNQLTQAIGTPYYLTPEYNQHPLNKGDMVLLCSDGLWDMLSDEEIKKTAVDSDTPEDACKKLIEKANESGGEDNITVVLIKI